MLQYADIYDALTSTRPYKRAFTSEQAIEIMRQETGRGWRDPELLPVFADLMIRRGEASLAGWEELAAVQESLDNMRRHVAEPSRNGHSRIPAERPVIS